jgi:hypothetical protein
MPYRGILGCCACSGESSRRESSNCRCSLPEPFCTGRSSCGDARDRVGLAIAFDQLSSVVLSSVTSPHSKRNYAKAYEEVRKYLAAARQHLARESRLPTWNTLSKT